MVSEDRLGFHKDNYIHLNVELIILFPSQPWSSVLGTLQFKALTTSK